MPTQIWSDTSDLLAGMARDIGIELDSRTIARISEFAELLLKWNRKINLVGTASTSELAQRHLLDGLMAARHVHAGDLVADVGSGGGLPGLPLALAQPEARFHFFEPVAKKVAFLRTAVRTLSLEGRVSVHGRRLEASDLGEWRAAFDVACARAVLAPLAWLELGRKLVRPGGRVLVFAAGSGVVLPEAASSEVAYGGMERRRLLVFERHAVGQRST